MMPPFRDWPVCWLFLLATAAIDASMVNGSAVSPWAAGLVVGQIMLVGIWVVHGQMHRLLRGCVFVAGLGGLSALADRVIEPYIFQRWFLLLAATLAIQSTVAAAAAATAWARPWFGVPAADPQIDDRWQYPLIEIFGWTIVVAAASVLLRYAAVQLLLKNPALSAFWLTGSLVAGICGSLAYEFRRWRRAISIPALLLLPGIFWLAWLHRSLGGDVDVMRGAQLYLAAYFVCRWLDAAATPVADSSAVAAPVEPRLQSHDIRPPGIE